MAWPFHAAQVETPVYRTQRRRSWRKFDVDQFGDDLQSSCLCDGFTSSSLGEDDSLGDDASVIASRLDEVVITLLDTHAPMTEITCRVRRSSDKRYDSECRSAKRGARGYERRFKRSRTDAASDSWMGALKTMHHLVRSKRKHFRRSRVDTGRDQASLWRVINDGLGRGGDGPPFADPGLSAEAFADYFNRKVGAPPPVFRDISTSDQLYAFVPVTTDVVCTLVRNAADKYSMKDPMPAWLLKTCIDLLAPYIASLFNLSLSSGIVPTSCKDA